MTCTARLTSDNSGPGRAGKSAAIHVPSQVACAPAREPFIAVLLGTPPGGRIPFGFNSLRQRTAKN